MGYTTEFSGRIGLSRALTAAEVEELGRIREEPEVAGVGRPRRGYLQWVPTPTGDAIVWDGEEKFYEYVDWMRWLCGWLGRHGIDADGEVSWTGEDPSDQGILSVARNQVTSEAKAVPPTPPHPAEAQLEALKARMAAHVMGRARGGRPGGPMPPELQAELAAIMGKFGGPRAGEADEAVTSAPLASQHPGQVRLDAARVRLLAHRKQHPGTEDPPELAAEFEAALAAVIGPQAVRQMAADRAARLARMRSRGLVPPRLGPAAKPATGAGKPPTPLAFPVDYARGGQAPPTREAKREEENGRAGEEGDDQGPEAPQV